MHSKKVTLSRRDFSFPIMRCMEKMIRVWSDIRDFV